MSEKHTGNAGEQHAASALRRIGVHCVEEIGTPFVITNRKKFGGGTWLQGFFKERVSGDHRGVTAEGISVLAETKTIVGRNLRWSDFKEHQPGRLDEHARYAISLLVWVSERGIFVMRWPVPGFEPGQSLTVEQAERLTISQI